MESGKIDAQHKWTSFTGQLSCAHHTFMYSAENWNLQIRLFQKRERKIPTVAKISIIKKHSEGVRGIHTQTTP